MNQVRSEIARDFGSGRTGSAAFALGALMFGPRFFLRLRDFVEPVVTNFSNLIKTCKELIVYESVTAFQWADDNIRGLIFVQQRFGIWGAGVDALDFIFPRPVLESVSPDVTRIT